MRYLPVLTLLAIGGASPVHAAPTTRAFSVTGFDRIAVAGPFDVIVHTGPGVSVRATGDPQALERLNVSVESGLLRIRPTVDMANGWVGASMGRVAVAVTVPSLRAASLFGSGGLAIDRVKAGDFRASLDGSGDLALGRLEADRLMVMVGGSGNVSVAGKAASVQARLVGSGDLDAAGLSSADATVSISGSGNVKLAVSHSASVTANGSGDVAITGGAKCTVAQHGSGDVACGRR